MVGCIGVDVVMGMCTYRCHGVICFVDCHEVGHLVVIVSVGLMITFIRIFVCVWCADVPVSVLECICQPGSGSGRLDIVFLN